MLFARQLAAASMALLLAVFPLALERCWTACVTPAVETEAVAPAAHACHEAPTSEDGGARIDPIARACGHSDDGRPNQTAGLAPVKTRTLVLVPGVEPAAYPDVAVGSDPTYWSSPRPDPPLPPLPLNLPLRL